MPTTWAIPASQVEQRVTDCYRTIELTVTQRKNLEEIVLVELHLKQQLNETHSSTLEAEMTRIKSHQAKLLDVHYADAIPKDLFQSEQRRLKSELTHLTLERAKTKTNFLALEQELKEVLDLLEDAHVTYKKADEQKRRQLNQQLFNRILLGYKTDQIRIELHEQYTAVRRHAENG